MGIVISGAINDKPPGMFWNAINSLFKVGEQVDDEGVRLVEFVAVSRWNSLRRIAGVLVLQENIPVMKKNCTK